MATVPSIIKYVFVATICATRCAAIDLIIFYEGNLIKSWANNIWYDYTQIYVIKKCNET